MPIEHHEPVTCVTFSLDEAAQIAAARANFRRRILSRRMLLRLAIGMVGFACAGLAFGWAIGDPHPVWMALTFGAEVLLLSPLLCVIFYALIPLRVRRLVRQNPLSSRPVEACWSPVGLSARSENGNSEFPWRDFYGWHVAAPGFLLYLNEQQYHLIPATILSEHQRSEMRAILEASGLRRL